MTRRIKIIGFIALSIAMFMGMLDSTIVNIALPDITDYFHANLKDTSWISTVYVMGLAVFTITASKIADQYGRKKIMIIGLVLFGGSSALCGLSHTLITLILMRLMQSVGGSIITPLVMPMGFEIFGKEKLRPIAGSVGAVTALAAAGGPPIGGLLIKYINWQSIFFVNVPFSVISLLLIALFIGESYDKTVSKKIDWAGMFLLTAALFLLTFSLLKGNDYGWGSAVIISMFFGSAVAFILFFFTESKVKAPMVELHFFREYTFTASSICCLITGFGIASPILIFSYFLQNALGYEALKAALIIMAISLTVIISMPLGTVLAGRYGARPVNFLGLLCMGIGVFSLSRLTLGTSDTTMIVEMIVCGIGLGFASQSIISSIKYLPQDKTGMGSGVVNAARQVGICIGIALLVSFLNTNITGAENTFKNNSVQTINKSSIADSVKTVMVKDIDNGIAGGDYSSITSQQDLQDKLQNDIQKAVSSLPASPPPSDAALSKLYKAASSLSSGADNASAAQNSLNSALGTLSTGLNSLTNGSESLSSGIGTLDSGLSKALAGSQELNSAVDQQEGTFTAGVGEMYNGANQMLSQFSPSGNAQDPSVYDGITGTAGGAQSLSVELAGYVSGVDNTLFLMIKNDPDSVQMLNNYKSSLTQAIASYNNDKDSSSKAADEQQIQELSNLVALYTAGTDSAVTNVQQFESELNNQAQQSENNQSVVSDGAEIITGADKLSSGSQQVAAQFSDGGTFKNSMKQLVNGSDELYQSSSNFSSLQSGLSRLNSTLSQLANGAVNLFTGSQNLNTGIISAKSGSDQILSGSSELVDASSKIKDGTAQLVSGVGLAGQKSEINIVVNKIKADKNNRISGAFDKTFLLAAIILLAASVCGLFTDRKLQMVKTE